MRNEFTYQDFLAEDVCIIIMLWLLLHKAIYRQCFIEFKNFTQIQLSSDNDAMQ